MFFIIFSSNIYTETYENASSDQFNQNVSFNQHPQYSQADQFISSPLPHIPSIQDQEMIIQEQPQDSNIFQLPSQNQIQFQEPLQPTAIDESLQQTSIQQNTINEQVIPERPETPGSNVRITRSRLRGGRLRTSQDFFISLFEVEVVYSFCFL